uniref:Secreted protein n=1 Tax=Sus scrofa TaxID=9823 RepID=A0A8D0R4C9_PIG
MRRLLEPCWWILFLKITSSVLHYVVCFPGECRPPRDAALAGASGVFETGAMGRMPLWVWGAQGAPLAQTGFEGAYGGA